MPISCMSRRSIWATGTPTQIVCGAPNVAAGEKVIVATINSTLYPTGEQNGFKIKKSKIRGVESLGMLCAEDEIGVGTAHDGIIVLPQDVPAVRLPATISNWKTTTCSRSA